MIAQERPRLRLLVFAGASDGDEPRSRTLPSQTPGGRVEPAAPRRVLVIDDESSIRLLTSVNLTASGMEVLEAPDGAAGVELARRELPDIVLLDVMMPGVDGWEVAGSWRPTRRPPRSRSSS